MKENLARLWAEMKELHDARRRETFAKYKRINPFYEDLFDWKERGEFWVGGAKGVTIYNSTTIVGNVEIGDNTWVGPFCTLDGTGGLKIGKYCSISLGCHLASHDTVKWALSGGRHLYEYSPISIGDSCFLGSHVVVTRGVSIGSHCLIGAGAVVTRDLPANSISAGVPARRIGSVVVTDDGEVHLEFDSRS